MVMTVHCDVVSAEESIFSGLVEIAVFPGEAGELGILPKNILLCQSAKLNRTLERFFSRFFHHFIILFLFVLKII